MDVVAFVLALLALVCFALDIRRRATASELALLPLGLALLTGALICQFTTISDNLVNF